MEKKVKRLSMAFMVLGGIIIIIAGSYKHYEYQKAETEYRKISKKYKQEREAFPINVDELKSVNSDFIGWIHIAGLFDYPVVKGADNSHYLYYTFEQKRNNAGAIFMNYENDFFNDGNTIIYGHNMLDGSMFESIKYYKDKAMYDKNPYIIIYTVDKKRLTYEIVAFQETIYSSENYRIPVNKEEMERVVSTIRKGANYKTRMLEKLSEQDRIITLSTCKWGGVRYVLQGLLIEEKQY